MRMNIFKKELVFSSLVFVLAITPHACLVEQVIASAAELLPHSHEQGAEHDSSARDHHDEAVPSHCHDESGREAEFCCDNEIYFYLSSDNQFDFKPGSNSYLITTGNVVEDDQTFRERVEYYTYLRRLRQPLSIRSRDRYALSCLLHAPPLS